MQCLDKVAARPRAGGANGGGNLIRAVGGACPPSSASPSASSSSSPPSSSSSSAAASQRARLTYTCDRHLFNFLAEPGPTRLTFCAVSPESAGRALPFAFLERVAADLHSRSEDGGGAFSPSALAAAPAHALDRAFGPRLALAADFVAQHPEAASKVAAVQRQVDAVRDVMVENIERVLERGERIELLVDKTDGLRDQAARFQASGRALRQRMWWNVSCLAGFFFSVKRRRKKKNSLKRENSKKTLLFFFKKPQKQKPLTEHEDASDGRGADLLLTARRLRVRVLLRRELPVVEEALKKKETSFSLCCLFFRFFFSGFISSQKRTTLAHFDIICVSLFHL